MKKIAAVLVTVVCISITTGVGFSHDYEEPTTTPPTVADTVPTTMTCPDCVPNTFSGPTTIVETTVADTVCPDCTPNTFSFPSDTPSSPTTPPFIPPLENSFALIENNSESVIINLEESESVLEAPESVQLLPATR